MIKHLSMILAGLALLLLAGCMPAPVPMATEAFQSDGPVKKKDLVVFFPGRQGSFSDFKRVGYDRVLREQLPAADAVSVDARMGYYRHRTLEERVKVDALDAYQAGRHRRVYLVGLSMGGLGAILTARRYPEEISGILLISPFLGRDGILDEITGAGGLQDWQPGEYDGERDWQRMIWDLLKQHGEGKGDLPPITLAYGREDYLGKAHRLLGDALPPDRVIVLPGEHTDETFLALWSELLKRVE